jgi:phosphoesterase RecJ-like protein
MVPPPALLDFLSTRSSLLVLTHLNPDADGLGASLALADALEQLGTTTLLADRDPVPGLYRFLPGSERFRTIEELTASGPSDVVLIDCNHVERVVGSGRSFPRSSGWSTVAVIDHHERGTPYGDITWIVPEAPATGLMVYHLIKSLGAEITEAIATNLYAAIMLDTGNFRYENTSAEVLRVAAELTEAGTRPHVIFSHLYELWPRNRFDLFLMVLNSLHCTDGVAVTTVTRHMLDKTGTSSDDTETFVSFPRIMKDITVSVLIREIDDGYYKVSLRSKHEIDVAAVARIFGGGGHKNAAGCTIRGDLETVKALILGALQSH